MFKVLICDDEGIARQALRFIIDKSFGDCCQVEEARGGRQAIELCESFRPDIAFMDIQMPGINGIDAMKEIRKENPNIIYVVLTAYDNFEYAKMAIDLGVLEYLTKPVGQDTINAVMRKAIRTIEDRRQKNSRELEVKEKLKKVVPVIENGFIYDLIMQEGGDREETGYEALLNIEGKHGFVEVVQFGDEIREGRLTNPVGSNVKMQREYAMFREIVKEFMDCIVGAPMGNKVVLCIPRQEEVLEYDERVKVIETSRAMVRKLEQRMDFRFKVGIGSSKPIRDMARSYHEALSCIRQGPGKVVHIQDVTTKTGEEMAYPSDQVREMFDALERGDEEAVHAACDSFGLWLQSATPQPDNAVRLRLMELALRAEDVCRRQADQEMAFRPGQDLLAEVMACRNMGELVRWFGQKMTQSCAAVRLCSRDNSSGVVGLAKTYIEKNYAKGLSLEEISREVNISPYYFSKIFKEEEGVNYIDYLTDIRIRKSKDLLADPEVSIKSICVSVGYTDPNYFSRIFKKCVGCTPTEYREGLK